MQIQQDLLLLRGLLSDACGACSDRRGHLVDEMRGKYPAHLDCQDSAHVGCQDSAHVGCQNAAHVGCHD